MITEILIQKRQEFQRQREVEEAGVEAAGFEDGERATSQRMWAASTSWKDKETDSLLESPEGTLPHQHLTAALCPLWTNLTFDLQDYNKKSVLFEAAESVVICYSRYRKCKVPDLESLMCS